MPKSWEKYRDEIERLYMNEDVPLPEVMEIMRKEHNFVASTRSYKMRFKEWGLGKNKTKASGSFPTRHSGQKSLPNFRTVSGEESWLSKYPDHRITSNMTTFSSSSRSTSTESEPIYFHHTSLPILSPPTTSLPLPTTFPISPHKSPTTLSSTSALVNSSLMFFSTRSTTSSLAILSQTPSLAPRALEILLRNWRLGGEFLCYLEHFLSRSECCHSIVGVNWTRWTHTDETLFDLVEENICEEERKPVLKALLKADYQWRHELGVFNAPWARNWRKAINGKSWAEVEGIMETLETTNSVTQCAWAFIAEAFVERVL